MRKILSLLFTQVTAYSFVFAQSNFDYFNIYEIPVFKPDSIAEKNKIKSITEYESELNKTNKKISFKKYNNNGFLIEYEKYFPNCKFIFHAKVLRENVSKFIVKYTIGRTDYAQDSLFFDQEFGGFVSRKDYLNTEKLDFLISYIKVGDSAFKATYILDGTEIGKSQLINDYDSKYFKSFLFQKQFKKSYREKDALVTVDTFLVDGEVGYRFNYNTIYDKPIMEDCVNYKGDTISSRFRIIRKYDNQKRLIFYGEYGDYYGKKLILAKSEKTEYHSDAGYTTYEDRFMADGKPDIIEQYNKNGLMINYKRYYSEGGDSEEKFTYSKSGLLLKSTQYLNGKYVSKTDCVYELYK